MSRTVKAAAERTGRLHASPVPILVTTFKPLESAELQAISAVSPAVRVRQAPLPAVSQDSLAMVDLADAEILFTTYVPMQRRQVPSLRWVHLTSAGADAARQSELWTDPAVIFTTSSGIHAAAMSQWAIALILYHAQHLENVLAYRNHRRWPEPHQWPANWSQFAGEVLIGKTLGLLGFGSAGRECARLGRALGMSVIAARRRHDASAYDNGRYVPEVLGKRLPLDGDVRQVGIEDIDEVIASSDYLVCTLPLTEDTYHLMGSDKFALMKEGAFFLNIGRGGVVDEIALVDALRSGHLAGAALDVFSEEPVDPDSTLFETPNLIMSPHVAGLFADYWRAACSAFCTNLSRYLDRAPMLNVVDRTAGY